MSNSGIDPNLVSVLGKICPLAEVRAPHGDIGWRRGFGVYETLFHYPGGCFQIEKHLARLCRSASLLHLPEFDLDELREHLLAWQERAALPWSPVRIVAMQQEGTIWWMIEACPATGPRPSLEDRTLSMWMAEIPIPPSPLGSAKTISRVSYELAGLRAKEMGLDDALMPTIQGHLGESTRASVFFAKDGQLYTPTLELGILPGVTRDTLLETWSQAGQPVEEGTFPFSSLHEADEVFVTSTIRGIAPVGSLKDSSGVETHLPVGEFARRSEELLMEQVRAQGLLAP